MYLALEEYSFTICIVASVIAFLSLLVYLRRDIAKMLSERGLGRRELAAAIAVAVFFLAFTIAVVEPTQQLFFDDVIYQSMALMLLHTGQAVMCNFGTPYACFSGQVFHEPIGEAFNLALGFAIFGVNRYVAYYEQLFITMLAVLATFFVSFMVFRNFAAAIFSEILMALTPVLLVWAFPTTSDMPMLLFSVIAVFAMLVFANKKNVYTFAFALSSLAMLAYMKVDALLYIPLIFVMYLLFDWKNVAKFLGRGREVILDTVLDTRTLVVVLLFVLVITPEVVYANGELLHGHYGATGTYVPESCSSSYTSHITDQTLGLDNFESNLCANVYFWFDQYQDFYKGYYIIQPALFTVLAILGAAFALFIKGRRSAFLAVGVWFMALWVLYTSFYAGAVTFGVDWRFVIPMTAPVCIFGGYGVYMLSDSAEKVARRIMKSRKKLDRIRLGVYGIIIIAIAIQSWVFVGPLSIPTSEISQAGSARFYEHFVYTNASKIPSSCLVFSYDPTLFMLTGHASAQLYMLSPSSYYNFSQEYGCLVIDYGYWCYTPNSVCSVKNQFLTEPIATGLYARDGKMFGLYRITGLNS